MKTIKYSFNIFLALLYFVSVIFTNNTTVNAQVPQVNIDDVTTKLKIGINTISFNDYSEEADKIKKEKEILLVKKDLEAYLTKLHSPMAPYSSLIIDTAMECDMDYRIVVGISGAESTWGKYNYHYNAWGWGHYKYNNWEDAIVSYTCALSKRYIHKGLDTPYKIVYPGKGRHGYGPWNKSHWISVVNGVIAQLPEIK